MKDLCSWCVGQMCRGGTRLEIDAPGSAWPPETRERNVRILWNGSVLAKLALVREAIGNSWPIMLEDASGSFIPVATWHGDPACQLHLPVLIQQYEPARRSPW